MPVEPTGRQEEKAQYYDDIYRRPGGYDVARFKPVYDVVLDWLSHFSHVVPNKISVLECGCGIGALAECILAGDYSYHGFDFSNGAIGACTSDVQPFVWRASAYAKSTWRRYTFNTVVAIEVFEHLDDHAVLRWIPNGVRVIFSVPNFNSYSHLRTYPDTDSVQAYFRGKLTINRTHRIETGEDKAIIVCDAMRLKN